ncbi:hypothetical protein [uncultured Alistipes sp.]|uniref:hypothetical protein n=1 Tax=uncultured Alistipes sp. TaxID=538949 RepID=UPI0026178695|nr:hypothetical protein [uncultured Alistipes sp.]
MKEHMYTTLLLAACLSAGCGAGSRGGAASDGSATAATQDRKPTATVCDRERSVTLRDPYMQNAEALTIDCLPGWQLVGKMDIEEFRQSNGSISFQIKGSDGARQLGFYTELCRPYYDENDGVPAGQRHPLLRSMKRPYTTAEAYLRHVAESQFPDARSVEVVETAPYDQVPEAFRRRADQFGQIRLNQFRQGLAQSVMGSSFAQILSARPDAAVVLCSITLKNGQKLLHALNACFFILDVRMPAGTMRTIDRRMWEVIGLTTYTAPNREGLDLAARETERMKASLKMNDRYVQRYATMQQAAINRIQQNVRAGILRNRQQAARLNEQIRQTTAEIGDIQMSMYESTGAMQDRVAALRSEAIRGVNPYVSSDGTVVDVPIGSGTQVWSTSDAGTILSSDSYFFNPNIGSTIEYQEMQLLR